jgi:CheY-like chemotaxis protein
MNAIDIVVADDELEIRSLVTDILEEAGYRVHAVGDGISALAAIRDTRPAAVLMDVAMPAMTGDEALRRLRGAGNAVPVVMMTAATDPQRFLQVGATAVLRKPFDLEELLEVIRQAHGPPGYYWERAVGDDRARNRPVSR